MLPSTYHSLAHAALPDPVEQTLFEVYAAIQLNCPYNDFDNH